MKIRSLIRKSDRLTKWYCKTVGEWGMETFDDMVDHLTSTWVGEESVTPLLSSFNHIMTAKTPKERAECMKNEPERFHKVSRELQAFYAAMCEYSYNQIGETPPEWCMNPEYSMKLEDTLFYQRFMDKDLAHQLYEESIPEFKSRGHISDDNVFCSV